MDTTDSSKPHPGTETYRRRCWKGLSDAINIRRTELESKLYKQQQDTSKGLSECNRLEELYRYIKTLPEDIQDGFIFLVCTGV